MQKEKLEWSGERLEPFIFNQTTIEHLHRYGIVMPFITDKTVLDIACGDGYGSNLLATKALNVIGVDIDLETIKKAKRYDKPNLTFKHGSADDIPVADKSIDVVISFETIEHHDKHQEMMKEIKRVLKPEGILIISSPEKTAEISANRFHIKELTQNEFTTLIGSYFKFYTLYTQKTIHGSFISAVKPQASELDYQDGDFTHINFHKYVPSHEFNILIANDVNELALPNSFFDGEAVLINSLLHPYLNSRIYRLTQFLKKTFRFNK